MEISAGYVGALVLGILISCCLWLLLLTKFVHILQKCVSRFIDVPPPVPLTVEMEADVESCFDVQIAIVSAEIFQISEISSSDLSKIDREAYCVPTAVLKSDDPNGQVYQNG